MRGWPAGTVVRPDFRVVWTWTVPPTPGTTYFALCYPFSYAEARAPRLGCVWAFDE